MKDPTILFYPGDWLSGTILFTRRHKGAYMDLLITQFNSGHLSEQDVKDVLGDDYAMWQDKLKAKFKQDSEGRYYNQRWEDEMNRRKKYSESRRKNLGKKYKRLMDTHMTSHMEDHMENETETETINENKNEIVRGIYNTVISFFEERFRPKTDNQIYQWYDTIDKLVFVDKYKVDEVINVIRWAREDPFWKTNFMSLLKLRKTNKEGVIYFDVFYYRMQNPDGNKKKEYKPRMSTKFIIPGNNG